jgi:energy-coupling factor transporter transmembrane protein EcfT
MSNPHDQQEKPSLFARFVIAVAWLVLFSSAAIFVMTTAQPELVDGVARKYLPRQ